MFHIGSWFYAGTLIFFATLWPFSVLESSAIIGWILIILNISIVAFVWQSCSTMSCSYWKGLNIISASMMSGYVGFTIIYAFPTLAVVYILSIAFAFEGLVKRTTIAGEHWERLVLWFYNKRIDDMTAYNTGYTANFVRQNPYFVGTSYSQIPFHQ